jgi:3-methylfumaryl-CoA hydratase
MKHKTPSVRQSIDTEYLRSWIGKQDIRYDEVSKAPVNLMAATLNKSPLQEKDDSTLPPAWHWLYFLSSAQTSNLAADGHANKGGFLPPIPLSRRMWAGGRLEFLHPIAVGACIKRVSTISDVQHKTGASGELLFVTLNHEIYCDQQLAIRERQDLVYQDAPSDHSTPARCVPALRQAQWSRTVTPTPALLFRYSALTFNAHRIHYDKQYAINADGHAGLVVHGPLLATLLLDLLLQKYPSECILSFDYRAMRPLYAGIDFELAAALEVPVETSSVSGAETRVQLWASDFEGCVAMRAEAHLLLTT